MAGIREIENIFSSVPEFCCFACSPANERGLRLRFFLDEDAGEVFTTLSAPESFSGFPRILHGG